MSIASQTVPGAAVGAVKFARRCLLDAQFRLGDAGLANPILDDLTADAGALLAIWAGRVDIIPDVPGHIARSAAEWRAERARRRA